MYFCQELEYSVASSTTANNGMRGLPLLKSEECVRISYLIKFFFLNIRKTVNLNSYRSCKLPQIERTPFWYASPSYYFVTVATFG